MSNTYRCSNHIRHDIADILQRLVLSNNQSIKQSINQPINQSINRIILAKQIRGYSQDNLKFIHESFEHRFYSTPIPRALILLKIRNFK
jgi:glycerate-2-kinase